MHTMSNYPSVTEDNKGIFAILTQTLVVAKREGVEEQMKRPIYEIGMKHDIDFWDLDEASELELTHVAE